MSETLRGTDGWTITADWHGYTLTRGEDYYTHHWTRRGYRCSCGMRGCDHLLILKAAQVTPTTGDWSGTLEPCD